MPPRASGTRRRDESSDEDDEQSQKKGRSSQEDIKNAVSQLVRMALFHEYKRAPLQRKVAAPAILRVTRDFPVVLQRAQTVLQTTFGMELHELRTRQKEQQAEEVGETQARQGSKGSGNYILRSILPADVIEGMANPVSLPISADMTDAETEERRADSGALLQWEKGDGTLSGNVALLGIRTVILCLVLCLGRVAQDNALHALLRRLSLQRDTVLPYKSKDTPGESMTLDKYLDLLARQNYLEKASVNNPTGEGKIIEWRWGSREAEFSEEAAAAFIEQIILGEEDDEESDDEPQQEAGDDSEPQTAEERREAKRRKLRSDLERVAGGPLQGER